jgi:hypothetical protein
VPRPGDNDRGLSSAPSLSSFRSELAPVLDGHVHIEPLGRGLDPVPSMQSNARCPATGAPPL